MTRYINCDNQTILHVKAGHLPPNELIDILLAKKPTAWGFAVQSTVDGKPDLAITREDATGLTRADLLPFFEGSKAFPRTVYFGQLNEGYNPEDIQPFVVNDGNDDPFMAFFIEGDIIANSAGDHTEQANLVHDHLVPKVIEWADDFDGDLEKIIKKLKGSVFERDLMTHIAHRCVMNILPVEGEPLWFGKNNLGVTEDWGNVSMKHGYGDPKAAVTPAPVVTEKKKGFWSGRSKAAEASPPLTASPTATPEKVQDAATSGSHDRYPAKSSAGKAPDIVVRPPDWARKNDDVKLFYNIVGNEPTGPMKSVIPGTWKKRTPIVVRNPEAIKITNLADFTAYALKRTQQSGATSTSSGKPPEETGRHDAKVISGVAGQVELPIIGPKELEKVLDFIAKNLDTSSREIVPPKEIQAMETDFPKFSTAVGLSVLETVNWPVNALMGIGKTDYRAIVMYALEWRSIARALAMRSKVDLDAFDPTTGAEITVEKGANSVTTTSRVGSTVKQESIATNHKLAKAELQPEPKKKGFWSGKKAA